MQCTFAYSGEIGSVTVLSSGFTYIQVWIAFSEMLDVVCFNFLVKIGTGADNNRTGETQM